MTPFRLIALVMLAMLTAARPVCAQPAPSDQINTSGSSRGGNIVADARAWWAHQTDDFRTQTGRCLDLLDQAESHRLTAMRYYEQAKAPGLSGRERSRLTRLANDEYTIVSQLVRQFYVCARAKPPTPSDRINTGTEPRDRPAPTPQRPQPTQPQPTQPQPTRPRPDRFDTDDHERPAPKTPRNPPEIASNPTPAAPRNSPRNTPRTTPRTSKASQRTRVVVLGDSIAVRPDSANNFPAQLQTIMTKAGFAVQMINASGDGRTSGQALAALSGALAQRPQVVIVEVGSNDGLKKVPLPTYRGNLRAIVSQAKAAGARVLLCESRIDEDLAAFVLGESDPYVTGFNQVPRSVAAEQQVRLVPSILEDIAGDPRLTQPDRIHPNAAGAKLIASRVWNHLSPLLRTLP